MMEQGISKSVHMMDVGISLDVVNAQKFYINK